MKRQKQLDGLRFIFICIIFLCHFECLNYNSGFGLFYDKYLRNPTLATDFFFMLSGFGIYYSFNNSNNEVKTSFIDSLKYGINKIKKIYPIYLFSLLIGIPNYLYTHIIEKGIKYAIAKTMANLALCIPLLQSLTGMTSFSRAINGTCWHLSSLFIGYMFCPLFINFTKKINSKKELYVKAFLTYLLIMIFSFIALSIEKNINLGQVKILGYNLGTLNFDALWYEHPFIRCLYLLMGMYVAKLTAFRTKEISIKTCSILEITTTITTILFYLFKNSIQNILYITTYQMRFFDLLYCFFFLYVFSFGKGYISKLLSSNIMVKLGSYSMYIYLFHYPISLSIHTLVKYGYIGIPIPLEVLIIVLVTILVVIMFNKIKRTNLS